MDSLRRSYKDLSAESFVTKSSNYAPGLTIKPHSILELFLASPVTAFSAPSPWSEGVGLEVVERASRTAAQFNGLPLVDAKPQGSCPLPKPGPEKLGPGLGLFPW